MPRSWSAAPRSPSPAASQPLDTSQFALPLGNLLVTGGIGEGQGMAIWAHQAAPDTRGPEVSYHIPRAGQANYPLGAPISVIIHETLEMTTLNAANVRVRVVTGGVAGGTGGAGCSGGVPLPQGGFHGGAPDRGHRRGRHRLGRTIDMSKADMA